MNKSGREGYALIETLAYIFVLTIMINLSVSLFVSTHRLSKAVDQTLERMKEVEEAGMRFGKAVHAAEAVAAEGGGYTSREDLLVLRLPKRPGDGNARRYLVLGAVLDEQHFTEMELLEGDSGVSNEFMRTCAIELEDFRFVLDTQRPEAAGLVRLELDVDNDGVRNTLPGLNTFVASLRGRKSGS